MKHAILITLALQSAVLAGYAHAAAPTGGDANPAGITTPATVSTQTRADVKAEAKVANKNGMMKGGDANPAGISTPNSTAGSTTTRAEVKADTKAAAARGELSTNDATVAGVDKPMKKTMRKHKMKKRVRAEAMASPDAQSK